MPTMFHPRPLALIVAEKAIQEFSYQWLCGLQPQLSLETAPNGQIRVCSRVVTGDAPIHPPPGVLHRDAGARDQYSARKARRRKGPAYKRRLSRRAAARVDAAAEVSRTEEQAVQTADEVVQLDHVLPQQLPCVPAVVVVPKPQPNQQPFPVLRDEMCSDQDYYSAVDVHEQVPFRVIMELIRTPSK